MSCEILVQCQSAFHTCLWFIMLFNGTFEIFMNPFFIMDKNSHKSLQKIYELNVIMVLFQNYHGIKNQN